jgi:hypothetical protein
MRSLKPVVVEILFGSVDDFGDRRRMPLYGWAATVSEQGVCVHLVMTGEKRDDVMPNPSRNRKRMQQDQGRFVISHGKV